MSINTSPRVAGRRKLPEYDLSVDFMGVRLKHPIIADSAGYALSPAGLKRLLKAGYSAVVTKSATYEPLPNWPRSWERSPRPRCYWDVGMDGTEALINPGFKRMAQYIKEVKPLAESLNAHIIGSFSPRSPEEAGEIAREYEKAGASAIHIDMVCSSAAAFRGKQHPGKGFDHLGNWWSQEPERAMSGMKAAQDAVDIPVVPKSFYAKWAQEDPKIIKKIEDTTGIRGLAMHTSKIPGILWIDMYRGTPYTYPKNLPPEWVMPFTLWNTMSVTKAATRPVMTAGGVTCTEDVVRLIMVGATAIGVCREIYRNLRVVDTIVEGLEAYMVSQALDHLSEIRGVALKHPVKAASGLAVEHDQQAVPFEAIPNPLAHK
jgi:dihydroorotate dehydrogenase